MRADMAIPIAGRHPLACRFDKKPSPGLASRRPMKPSVMPAALDDLVVVRGDMS
jgi:hypothetical protein